MLEKQDVDTRESEVEKYFVKKVEEIGGVTRKLHWIGRRGAPDRLAIVGWGRVFFVEFKRPGGKPDPHQDREIDRLRRKGATVYIIDNKPDVDQCIVREYSK